MNTFWQMSLVLDCIRIFCSYTYSDTDTFNVVFLSSFGPGLFPCFSFVFLLCSFILESFCSFFLLCSISFGLLSSNDRDYRIYKEQFLGQVLPMIYVPGICPLSKPYTDTRTLGNRYRHMWIIREASPDRVIKWELL